jgi:hypothetical protein
MNDKKWPYRWLLFLLLISPTLIVMLLQSWFSINRYLFVYEYFLIGFLMAFNIRSVWPWLIFVFVFALDISTVFSTLYLFNLPDFLNTIEYLGQNIDFIKKWIEFCFSNDMNWDNQGSFWHIDHVVPVSRFNLETEEDVIKCFNWKNIRPCEKIENYKKNNKIVESLINDHKVKVELYISLHPVPS